MKLRRSPIGRVLVAFALLVVACDAGEPGNTTEATGQSPTSTTGAPGTTAGQESTTTSAPEEVRTDLTIRSLLEPTDFNYVENATANIREILVYNVLEPLLEGFEDGTFEPLLAESYEVSPDGLEYQFTIRDAVFHDGSQVTADDVLYSLELNQSSPLGSVSGPLGPVESIDKVGDRTIRVTLSVPSQRFLSSMAGNSGLVIPQDSADDLATNPIGTGPFSFGEWSTGVDLTLERFDDYWGEAPALEQVTWAFIPDETAAFSALLAGDVDAIAQVAGDGLERLGSIGEEGFRVVSVPAPGIRYAVLNGGDERFADERVRQAIGHAIDRQPIIDGAVSGYGEPTCVFANPPNVLWASDYCPYPYDPDRARQLLAEAGAEGLSLEIAGLTIGTFPLTTEVLSAQLTAVGFSVDVRPVDPPTWLEDVPGGAFEFTHIGGSEPFDAFVCPGSFAHDCVEEVDTLLAEADASVDIDDWAELRREAIELHAERGYVIPLYTFPTLSVLPEGLVGETSYSHAVEFDLRDLRWEG